MSERGGEYICGAGMEYMSKRDWKSRMKEASEAAGIVWKCWATSGGGRLRNSDCQGWFVERGPDAVSMRIRSSGRSCSDEAVSDRENSVIHSGCKKRFYFGDTWRGSLSMQRCRRRRMQMIQLAAHSIKPKVSLSLSLRLRSEELVHHLHLAPYTDALCLSILSRHRTIASHSLMRSEPRHKSIAL